MSSNQELVIGQVVHYEDKNYECPALVVATTNSIFSTPEDPHPVLPAVSDDHQRAHLMVFRPDMGMTIKLEMNVPYDAELIPATYHWPNECDD